MVKVTIHNQQVFFPELPFERPPEPDYDEELIEAIKAATTIAGLKAALIGSLEGAKARVGGRPK